MLDAFIVFPNASHVPTIKPNLLTGAQARPLFRTLSLHQLWRCRVFCVKSSALDRSARLLLAKVCVTPQLGGVLTKLPFSGNSRARLASKSLSVALLELTV